MPENFDDVMLRLARLEDKEAIRQLFVDYGFHLDHGDFDAYGRLFADDGEVLLGPIGRAKGPEAITALMTKTLGGRQGSSYHVICNPVIHLDGDEATTDVTWVVVTRAESGAPAVTMLGRHRDVVVRQRGEWKFQRREGHVDLPSRYPA
jgi:ketosteroid isomerase-like protein